MFGAATKADGLRLTMFPDTNQLVLGEPIVLTAVLQNSGSEIIAIAPWAESFQFLISTNDSEFHEYLHYFVLGHDWRIHKRYLQAGELASVRLMLLVDLKQAVSGPKRGKNCLAITEPGVYQVKIKYSNLETPAATILVSEPQAVDRAIYNFIRTNDHLLMHYQFPQHELSTNVLNSLGNLLVDRPTSAYRRYYETIFKPRTTNSNLVKSASESPLQTAIRELESQWYDVKGFGRHHPEGHRPMLTIVMDLNDQLGQGKVSQEEFDTRRAELLRQYVRQYSKPLPPEEWKRRYEIYAKEDAERAAKQEAQQQEFLKNGARILQETPKIPPRK